MAPSSGAPCKRALSAEMLLPNSRTAVCHISFFAWLNSEGASNATADHGTGSRPARRPDPWRLGSPSPDPRSGVRAADAPIALRACWSVESVVCLPSCVSIWGNGHDSSTSVSYDPYQTMQPVWSVDARHQVTILTNIPRPASSAEWPGSERLSALLCGQGHQRRPLSRPSGTPPRRKSSRQ